jgi:hypothetical protein
VDISDQAVRTFMKGRINLPPPKIFEIQAGEVPEVSTELLAGRQPWGEACRFCLAPGCSYPDETLNLPWSEEMLKLLFDAMNEEPVNWSVLRTICCELIEEGATHKAKAYCFLARWISEAELQEYPEFWRVLQQFKEKYHVG